MKTKHLKKYLLVVLVTLLSWCMLPVVVAQAGATDAEEKGYLTFTSEKSFTIIPDGSYINLEYATGNAPTLEATWNTAVKGSTITATAATDGKYYIYFRGTNNSTVTGNVSGGIPWSMSVSEGAGISCHGNIETLLDYQTVTNGNHPTMEGYCFSRMFADCTSLIEAPELPAETMTDSCYSEMFSGCTSLTKAPKLPAEALDDYCYYNMFAGCTSLTRAPELPAIIMAEDCYQGMFSDCASLTEAPELPALTLANACYSGMFSNCYSLSEAPELPAITLFPFCYDSMFQSCSALTKIPELPATTLAKYCYHSMFRGCIELKISSEPTEDCLMEFIFNGDADYEGWNSDMFRMTGGTFMGSPERNRTYYVPVSYTIKTNRESLDIGTRDEGYANISSMITIKVHSNVQFQLTAGFGSENFTVSGVSDDVYDKNVALALTVTPKVGLKAGSYEDVLTVAIVGNLEKKIEIPIQYVVKEHTYDDACDSTCNTCEYERTVEHTYDNACDNTCNMCGDERIVGEHIYDNACDSTCNICEQVRAVGEHVYDNACDSTCNICEQVRIVGAHVYDNACDSTCNICGQIRTVAAHVYDDDEDDICNSCGFVRDTHYPVVDGYTYYATYEGCDFYRNANGDTRCYDAASGAEVYNAFKCDGTYTYYFQFDRTAMRDRLTYHPDGEHIIYFDKDGHEVFSDYGHITTSIAGDTVDDYCFFDVHGYMYVDVMTYDITGTKIYYANPYGVLEHNGWFTFSDGGYGYANGDMSLMTNQYTYDWNGNYVYMEGDGHIRGTGDGRNLWPASSL